MEDLEQIGRRVLQSQPFSVHLGAELVAFESGRATLALDVKDHMLQQHGYVHGGVISYLIDNAITFAAGSVRGENVVTAEFKVNYLRPAKGTRLIATAVVESSGTRLAVCRCEVLVIDGERQERCAIGQGTIASRG